MKARESGMPDQTMWESFFYPKNILAALQLDSHVRNAVDFGCGYGTFTLDIRPKPEECIKWAESAGFSGATRYDLKPYHYGIVLTKEEAAG